MAALNKLESEDIQKTIRLIEEVQRNGYDPALLEDGEKRGTAEAVARARAIARDLETYRRRLYTIHTMKGYYPK